MRAKIALSTTAVALAAFTLTACDHTNGHTHCDTIVTSGFTVPAPRPAAPAPRPAPVPMTKPSIPKAPSVPRSVTKVPSTPHYHSTPVAPAAPIGPHTHTFCHDGDDD